MARADTRTLIPLDTFFKNIGIHPLLANQVTMADITPEGDCGVPLLQYSWQHADRVGREEIAQAIADAEDRLAGALSFRIAPTWEVAETINYPRPYEPQTPTALWDVRGLWNTVRTRFGHVISGGVESKTLLKANATITYSDLDGDGYFERATITVINIPAGVTADQLAVYYVVDVTTPVTTAADPAWEIRPISATISGTTATIVCRREQLAQPALLMKMLPVAIDGATNASFVTVVDVYRRWNDPQTQVEFQWEEPCATEVGSFSTQAGVLTVLDSKLGVVRLQPATWDATTETFTAAYFTGCRPPDRVRLWYRAGWQYNQSMTQIDPIWQRAVTYYALALLDRPLCPCNTLSAFTQHWREDLALRRANQQSNTSYSIAQRILGNPFGTYRGAIYAWEQALRYHNPETAND